MVDQWCQLPNIVYKFSQWLTSGVNYNTWLTSSVNGVPVVSTAIHGRQVQSMVDQWCQLPSMDDKSVDGLPVV
ncbi:hypothetical protein DPMN_091949 [Dreissena polymorpha]|uniref:Uncharacterized protein n=1 Tax=Dreissena polymorpha TaxID=45954 RepID=A0A9D4L0S3_DREPO|nr:hypothetical protein DPMN_091949 [Dreissena polymorpha]